MGIRFRMRPKTGIHRHRHPDGRREEVHPGGILTVDDKDDLGGAVDKFEQIDPDPPPPQPAKGLKIRHRGHGRWDVVNEATGRRINDEGMEKADAQTLMNETARGGFPPDPGDVPDTEGPAEVAEED